MLQESTVSMVSEGADNDGIAIIGLAGRFPGAPTISDFWNNLIEGKDAQRQFTDEEISRHVPEEVRNSKDFMQSGYPLDNTDMFDASFFGIPPRQARLMDPQHRLFLECAWEALEDSGYGNPEDRPTVGVYASSALSTYLMQISDKLIPWEPTSFFEVLLGNDKDYLASRVNYKLGLNGPAVVVQSACSSSMLAVATACQALQDYQTDIALAGGVNVEYPQEHGCICKEDDGFISPHGQCRAFDADASGIVQGNGLGVVVLKRLNDALEDNDTIYAVIKGHAVNNDGSDKVGFTAPSVAGQRSVIAEALYVADVDPQSISYVEAHGTGTALGDPIEISALTSAYGSPWEAGKSCAIGSVKTNIGHLNVAAGAASLIKTALALHNKKIPASLHFKTPNPEIPFESTPFYVNTESVEWSGPSPLRAGVSSFGFGGTNVHMVLEEAPAISRENREGAPQVLPVSAKSQSGLTNYLKALAAYLDSNHMLSLADVAFTLQCGRAAYAHRVAFVCRDLNDAVYQIKKAAEQSGDVINTLHSDATVVESDLQDLASRWVTGENIQWQTEQVYALSSRRISLPTYPFERQRFVPDTAVRQIKPEVDSIKRPVSEWLHSPTWLRLAAAPEAAPSTWIVFLPEGEQAVFVTEELRATGSSVIEVRSGSVFSRTETGFVVNTLEDKHVNQLFATLAEDGVVPENILYLRHAIGEQAALHQLVETTRNATTELAVLARNIHQYFPAASISVVTSNLFAVTGAETLRPQLALLTGPVSVIATEYSGLHCRLIDVEEPTFITKEKIRLLLQEAACKRDQLIPGNQLALRNGHTWARCFAPVAAATTGQAVRTHGAYIITGGLGGMGLALAKHLATSYAPKLILTTSRAFPSRNEWEEFIEDKYTPQKLADRLQALIAIEELGAEILVLKANADSETDMRRVFEEAVKCFGSVSGVIHAAGVTGNGLLDAYPLSENKSNFAPKVLGTIVLDSLYREFSPDFVLLCSSLAVFGGVRGTADYISANAFMDAWAERAAEQGINVISVNWNTWKETGMASALDADAAGDVMTAEEGAQVCMHALASGRTRLTVCTQRVESLLNEAEVANFATDVATCGSSSLETNSATINDDLDDNEIHHPRPEIDEPYVAPTNVVESTLADIWAELLELEKVGVNDPFMDIGGDSLMALSLDTELRKIFPIKLPLNLILNHGTVGKLAEYLLADEESREETLRIAELYRQVSVLEEDELESQLAMVSGEEE